MVGLDPTVLVPAASQPQLSIIVVLEGFASRGVVRIEAEGLRDELFEILGI